MGTPMKCVQRTLVTGLAVLLFLTNAAGAVSGPPPPPPGPPPPPPPRWVAPAPPDYVPPPPPVVYYPPPPVVVAPPPLSPAMRIVYAPFYAAGVVLHDGFYYLIIAPFEVFGRALTYGVEGGVDSHDNRR